MLLSKNVTFLLIFVLFAVLGKKVRQSPRPFIWHRLLSELKGQFHIDHVNKFFDVMETEVNPLVKRKSHRIIGGTAANIQSYSFHVSLVLPPDKEYICGGVIVSLTHVVTAAHCVIMDYGWHITPDYLILIAGRNYMNETGEERHVKKITSHPDYVITTKRNDIAVIETKEPFLLSSKVSTIPLINYRVQPLTKCTVIGFGSPSVRGPSVSNQLLKVPVPIQSMLRCRLLFLKRVTIYDGMMCAGFFSGQRDACSGDSGGPLVCDNQLAGIVSAGVSCGVFYNPGIYSDVVYFRPFIDSVLAEANSLLPSEELSNSNSDIQKRQGVSKYSRDSARRLSEDSYYDEGVDSGTELEEDFDQGV